MSAMYTEDKLQLNFYHSPKSGFKGFVTVEENKGFLKKLYLAIYMLIWSKEHNFIVDYSIHLSTHSNVIALIYVADPVFLSF